ncbi:hypothetical protein RFI_08581 [Reticulomyxa filosa]|uniref:Uncharacterized protein n=1 Tax=Reticulomyxa filosa TaxID=46433 RepID=X6NQI1_RETFI|nr:hypothetical protein RFI_08581 [Reticulomyxa filosa]|eukprot:ETO28550.1 hypothetical protein RFI_08581 [Reticulomyxa filosa]
MDWFDSKKIDRFRGLLERLLKTSNNGIKEYELLSMWDDQKAQQIICELRFGVYSDLTHVHIDRFGRRFYTYKYKQGEQRTIFSNDLSIFGEDVNALEGFLEEVDEENNASIYAYNSSKKIHFLNPTAQNGGETIDERREEDGGHIRNYDNDNTDKIDEHEDRAKQREQQKEGEEEKMLMQTFEHNKAELDRACNELGQELLLIEDMDNPPSFSINSNGRHKLFHDS